MPTTRSLTRCWCAAVGIVAALSTAGCAKSSAPTPTAADGTLTLSGAAAEAPPNAHIIAGVRVQITEGPGAGTATTTDTAGSFRFTALKSGAITIVATKEGYLPWRVLNLSVETYPQIQIALYPVPPLDASRVSATARCNDGTWTWDGSFVNLCVGHGGIAYAVCPGPLCIGGRQ